MEEFRSLEHKGNLLFIQELFGGWYGIRREYLQSNAGYSLTEFHIDNVMLAVKNSLPILAIALVPQEISFLRERLERRGTETPTQIDNRVKSAEREIAKILNNRSSFSLVVEFSRDNEHTVVDRVWAFLKTHIPQLNSENQEKI
jgi:guanylate kinase